MCSEQPVDGAAHQTVAEIVERTLVLLEVRGGEAVANHHVIAFEHFLNHCRCCVCRVGVVAVGHYVYVGVNVFKHGSHYVALALTRFLAHNSAFGRGDFCGAICGVVVVHVNSGIRQRRLKITYHFADSSFLVVAGEEHGNGGIIICFRHIFDYNGCTGLRLVVYLEV